LIVVNEQSNPSVRRDPISKDVQSQMERSILGDVVVWCVIIWDGYPSDSLSVYGFDNDTQATGV
jgi:hypothetical protein